MFVYQRNDEMIYLIILVLLLIAELFYFRVADNYNIIDKPNLRSSHTSITLRGGGIIFLASVWIWAVFFGLAYPWFLTGLTAIAGISFIDDIHSVSNRIRLAVQFVAMLLMFQDFGILTPESWWMIVVALILCVGIINAYNFMDGINGITGGYSLAVFLPLIYLNSKLCFVENSFLIVVLIGVLVFNFFNFRKKAKCFAGDVGSVGIAFIILFALGKLILLTGDFTYILLLAVYGVDSVLTIVHRMMLHENIGEAHRKHVYQLMANELKIPHMVVSIIYMCLQLMVSFGLILWSVNHWIYLMMVLLILCLVYVWFKKKYYHLHEEYLLRQVKG
jgi:UDP-N-acetylmuramyl pentapeptide phosphotransferase/UDP-N-acetylglucosamine-1-phosphate transferase